MIPPTQDWSGKLPSGPRYCFSCCDHKYFVAYSPELAMSALEKGIPLHFQVFNPTPEAVDMAEFFNTLSPSLTVSWFDDPEDPTLKGQTGKQRAAYCCDMRHHVMPRMLELPTTERVYGVDTDSVFNKPFDMAGPSTLPLGIYLRDSWDLSAFPEADRSRMMSLLSLWWIDKSHIAYARAVSDYLNAREKRWMLDQEAHYVTLQSMGLRDSCFDVSTVPYLLDWSFSPEGVLWHGKGKLKTMEPRLINRRIVLKERYLALRQGA